MSSAVPSESELNLTVAQTGSQIEAAREASADAPQAPPPLPGYSLDKLLGRGSFGEVWAGTQQRSGLRVAVKVLTRREGLDWLYFKHEVGRLREVAEHPHVVSLIDADLSHEPPYFVMPLLLRGSLHEAREFDTARALVWFQEIASALRYCHEKGLLHCDLKPSNVMLDEEGHVRLVDYGQSRSKGDKSVTWGTLGFMAPEQAVLGGESVPSVRWDVYSLGATAYLLFTGQCPRLSETDRTELTRTEDTARRLEQYRNLLQSRPLIPVRKLNPKVDADLAAIVESCLELDPERRTASVEDVLDDLERRRTRDPLLCRRPWTVGYRLRRSLQKPRIALTILFLLLILTGGSWTASTVHYSTLAQFQYDGGVVAEQRGDLQAAYLRWAEAIRELPWVMQGKSARWSLRFNARLPWVLQEMAAPPTENTPGTALAFSPDGKLLVTGYEDGKLLLTTLADGSSRALSELGQKVEQVGVDDSGRVLALGKTRLLYDGEAREGGWTVLAPRPGGGWAVGSENGEVLLVPELKVVKPGPTSPVRCLAVNPAGKLAVALGDESLFVDGQEVPTLGQVVELVWAQEELQTRLGGDESLHRYDKNRFPFGTMQTVEGVKRISPGARLVASTVGTAVQVGGIGRGRGQRHILPHDDEIGLVVFSPQVRLLAVATADRNARIWRVDNGQPSSSVLRHGSKILAMEFSPDGTRLATLTQRGVLRIYGQASDSMSLRRLEHPVPVQTMALSDAYVATATQEGARLYPLAGGEAVEIAHSKPVLSVAFQPGQTALVTGSVDGQVRFFGLDGQPLGTGLDLGAAVSQLAFSPDGTRLAATSGDSIVLIDPARRSAGARLDPKDFATELAFSPDGRLLAASGAAQGRVTVWDAATGENRFNLLHPALVASVSFSPDSSWLLTSCYDQKARRWDMQSGQEMLPRFCEEQPLHSARVSPDDHLIALAGDERSARIFHLGDDVPGPLLPHRGPVLGVSFNQSGLSVATGSTDCTARVWDPYSGHPLTSSLYHDEPVTAVAFARDQPLLATLAGKTVSLWDLAPPKESARRLQLETEVDTGLTLDNNQVRQLTPAEWRERRAQLGP